MLPTRIRILITPLVTTFSLVTWAKNQIRLGGGEWGVGWEWVWGTPNRLWGVGGCTQKALHEGRQTSLSVFFRFTLSNFSLRPSESKHNAPNNQLLACFLFVLFSTLQPKLLKRRENQSRKSNRQHPLTSLRPSFKAKPAPRFSLF